jgi:Leucine-rich repeat (LRR) protein
MDDKENLNQYSNYLNLNRAKLKSIPKEVLDQKDSLESLDISGNNFNDFY